MKKRVSTLLCLMLLTVVAGGCQMAPAEPASTAGAPSTAIHGITTTETQPIPQTTAAPVPTELIHTDGVVKVTVVPSHMHRTHKAAELTKEEQERLLSRMRKIKLLPLSKELIQQGPPTVGGTLYINVTYQDGANYRFGFAGAEWNIIEKNGRTFYYETISPEEAYEDLQDYIMVLHGTHSYPELKGTTTASGNKNG